MKKSGSGTSRTSLSLPPTYKPAVKPASGSSVLDDIHHKIQSSSALNGGFETLLHKIDNIEHNQGQLVSKVDKIHEAIYDPSEGVFSKISEFKLESSQRFSEMSQHMSEINEWKKHREKFDNKKEDALDASSMKLVNLEQSVESLLKSKATTWSFIKWFLVALGGGGITLLFKWIEAISLKH